MQTTASCAAASYSGKRAATASTNGVSFTTIPTEDGRLATSRGSADFTMCLSSDDTLDVERDAGVRETLHRAAPGAVLPLDLAGRYRNPDCAARPAGSPACTPTAGGSKAWCSSAWHSDLSQASAHLRVPLRLWCLAARQQFRSHPLAAPQRKILNADGDGLNDLYASPGDQTRRSTACEPR